MLLSIIIVSYNTAQITLNSIKSLIEEINRSKIVKNNLEIFIVDNASQDKSVFEIKNYLKNLDLKKPPIYMVENSKNLGFARANNKAIKLSKGEFVLLLNSDTVAQPFCLDLLVGSMLDNPPQDISALLSSETKSSDKLGILASTLLNTDGTIQTQGGSVPSLFSLFNQMFFLDDIPILGKFLPTTQETGINVVQNQSDRLISKGWVGGTAMLLRKSMINEIGLLDQSIFMYGEDMEYCMRAKNHHFDIAIHPQSKFIHLGSASSSSENAILGEINGYLYVWAKHKPDWQMPFARAIIFLGIWLRIIVFSLFKNHAHKVKTYKKALNSL
jgi:GT2 family glycosyltransferase